MRLWKSSSTDPEAGCPPTHDLALLEREERDPATWARQAAEHQAGHVVPVGGPGECLGQLVGLGGGHDGNAAPSGARYGKVAARCATGDTGDAVIAFMSSRVGASIFQNRRHSRAAARGGPGGGAAVAAEVRRRERQGGGQGGLGGDVGAHHETRQASHLVDEHQIGRDSASRRRAGGRCG